MLLSSFPYNFRSLKHWDYFYNPTLGLHILKPEREFKQKENWVYHIWPENSATPLL